LTKKFDFCYNGQVPSKRGEINMKSINDPLSRKKRKTRVAKKSDVKVLMSSFVFVFTFTTLLGYYVYDIARRQRIYDSLNISFSSVTEIEYGTANYNPQKLVENVEEGVIRNYTKTVDTSTVGTKELIFEVGKDDIVKEIKVTVEVKDTKAPEITVTKDSVNIYQGYNYDVQENIESVKDLVDGDISYNDGSTVGSEESVSYYTVDSALDHNKVGSYPVTIRAVDKNANVSEKTFTVNVLAKKKTVKKTTTVSSNVQATVDTSSVTAAAYSLVGSRYRSGGNSPATGFDCSGFVQYVFSVTGKKISRSTSSQLYEGTAVSRSNMQPGDIIVWSTNASNAPTHVALYVGNGNMIHAANPRSGIIVSNVSYWESHGGGHIVSVRRV